MARPGMEQVRVSLVVVLSNQPGSRAFSLGARLFAFYTAYPQKRITAEIELIDKRNVQTYGDRAVVRPLTIPSGAQSPLLKPLGISSSPSCAQLVGGALMRLITDAAVQ